MRTLTSLALALTATLATGCLADDGVSTVDQDIKAHNRMFATQRLVNAVAVFTPDGERKDDMTGPGLTTPFGVHVQGDDVYVVSQGNHSVYAHLHDQHENQNGTSLTLSVLVPSGSGGLTTPFYPTVKDGVLYVSSGGTHQVLRYDASTGAPLGAFVAAGAGGIAQPRGLDFDSAGNLYVSSFLTNQVKVYDSGGNYLRDLGSIPSPCGVTIRDSDDTICAGSAAGPGIGGLHCWAPDGTKVYTGPAEGPVCGVDFGPDGFAYPTRPNINTIQQHDLAGGILTFVSIPSPGPSNIAGVSWGLGGDDTN